MPPTKGNDPRYLQKQYKDSTWIACPRTPISASINMAGPLGFGSFSPRCSHIGAGCASVTWWRTDVSSAQVEIACRIFLPGCWKELDGILKAAPIPVSVIDAQSTPFEDAHFDAVIANHMALHVPDRPLRLQRSGAS